MFILGACLGSFLCCQVRRLHLKEQKKKKKLGKRSVCLNCGEKIKWYDNIPIISWLVLRGKCRKCHKKIGIAEFLSELLSGVAFLMIGTTIDLRFEEWEWTLLAITLVFTISLIFLAIYDGIYGQLPTKGLIVSIIIGFIYCVLRQIFWSPYYGVNAWTFVAPLLSVAILGGVYLVLYLVSKGNWVGDGDWLLGTAIGLALVEPWLALIALFISNVLACIVMAPQVKKSKNKKIYLGPFMVMAFVIVYTFSGFFFWAISG